MGVSRFRFSPQIESRSMSNRSPIKRFFSLFPWQGTLGPAVLGALLMWAALPPLDLGWLGWFAPIPWLLLIRRTRLPETHPYRRLWLVGFCFWMVAFHFLRLPHPATSIGWVALSAYQGFYLPIFIGLLRVGVHRYRLSAVWLAPTVWTGLELARGHLLTGVTMGNLGHTQYRWLELIQVSDLFGAYVVSFIVMFVAAALAQLLPCEGKRGSIRPAFAAVALMAVVLVYGYARIGPEPPAIWRETASTPGVRVALVQGSIDSQLKSDPSKVAEIHAHYRGLTDQACASFENIDLIVWPETMYRGPLIECGKLTTVPPEWNGSLEALCEGWEKVRRQSREPIFEMARRWKTRWLLGVDTMRVADGGPFFYNSAVLVEPERIASERYDKMHRVLFGEYVPFADWFPWLAKFTPLPISLTAGAGAIAYEIDGVRFAPNICYESVLPHVIRRQLLGLRAEGQEPDVLVNLTNDGWFWGSSELDMHLICGIFRAVEFHKPFLVAANTGFSAWIDADGRCRARGPRREPGFLLATVGPDPRGSLYLLIGDTFAGICLLATLVLALVAVRPRYRLWRKRKRRDRRKAQSVAP